MVATRVAGGIAAIAAAAALTACAAQSSESGPGGTAANRPAYGTVSGRLVMEGGPLVPGGQQPLTRPMSGFVQFIGPGGQVVQVVKVGRSGSFTTTLVPGIYRVRGGSPAIVEVSSRGSKGTVRPCTVPKTLIVKDQGSVRVTLACVVP